ncbi:hypothetical protein [Chthonobacter rhizosphaerae]|uniref:hypothetical protein n=1 Tax=Chthonobacter rhizosphaerae TaxID=2735553 RepID=UPI0015EF61C0|nr:hypothetical protein [Chthonobacter rhizosphaerae]
MPETPTRIVITDVDIPFGRLILILLKIALASIPAAIILAILVNVVVGLVFLLFGGMMSGSMHW